MRVLGIFFLLLIQPICCFAPDRNQTHNTEVTMDVREIPVRDVLSFLGMKGGFAVQFVGTLENPRVTLEVIKQPIFDLIDQIALANGLAYKMQKDVLYVMTSKVFKERYGKDFVNPMTTLLKPYSVDAADVSRTINLKFDRLMLLDLVKYVAHKGNMNVICSGISGRISGVSGPIPAAEMLLKTAFEQRLKLEMANGLILVRPLDSQGTAFADGKAVHNVCKAVLDEGGTFRLAGVDLGKDPKTSTALIEYCPTGQTYFIPPVPFGYDERLIDISDQSVTLQGKSGEKIRLELK